MDEGPEVRVSGWHAILATFAARFAGSLEEKPRWVTGIWEYNRVGSDLFGGRSPPYGTGCVLFLAGALKRDLSTGSLGVGTRSRFVPRPDRPGRHSVDDSRLCRSQACASEMSDSGGRIMAQKASKKLPLCATFLPFPRHFRWLANDVFYAHGLEPPIGGRLEMTTRLSCPGLRR